MFMTVRGTRKRQRRVEQARLAGVDEVDLDLLAENSMKDACAPGNPFTPTKEEVIAMFKKIL